MSQKKRKRQQQSSALPLVMAGLGALLLVLAMVLLLTRNQPAAEITNAGAFTDAQAAAVERVTQADARAAFDAGEAVFLDVRGPAGFNAGHVPGAILMTLDELETRWTELDPNDWIIPYCTWPAEETSARAALFLQQKGFTRVTPLLGGFQGWVAADHPVETE